MHAYPSHCVRAGHGLARDRFDESWEDWKENYTRGEETKGVCASLNAYGDGFLPQGYFLPPKSFNRCPSFTKDGNKQGLSHRLVSSKLLGIRAEDF